jgi:hypothetical protein
MAQPVAFHPEEAVIDGFFIEDIDILLVIHAIAPPSWCGARSTWGGAIAY